MQWCAMLVHLRAVDVRLRHVAVCEVEALRSSEQGDVSQLPEAEAAPGADGGKGVERGLDNDVRGSLLLEVPDTRTDTYTSLTLVQPASADERIDASVLGVLGGGSAGGGGARDPGDEVSGDGGVRGVAMREDGQGGLGRSGGIMGGDGKKDLHLALRQLQELVGRWKDKDAHLDTEVQSPLDRSNSPSAISATTSDRPSTTNAADMEPGATGGLSIRLKDAAPTRVQHWLQQLGECVEEEEGGMQVNDSMLAAGTTMHSSVLQDVEAVPAHAGARWQRGAIAETAKAREEEFLLPSDGNTLVMFKHLSQLTGRHAEKQGVLQVVVPPICPSTHIHLPLLPLAGHVVVCVDARVGVRLQSVFGLKDI